MPCMTYYYETSNRNEGVGSSINKHKKNNVTGCNVFDLRLAVKLKE